MNPVSSLWAAMRPNESDCSGLEGGACREQPAKAAPVRTIAAGAGAYDSLTPDGGSKTMNVTLKPFDFAQAVARAGLANNGQPLARNNAVQGAGFQQALTQALGSVSAQQNESVRLQHEVQMDNPSVSLEQTMVAMQKAQVGFQATLAVRNRLVQAYSDIMNMQV
jgi:flagellar hook-basal body complex protein FliE